MKSPIVLNGKVKQLAVLAISLLTACGYNEFDPAAVESWRSEKADNMTILQLRNRYRGVSMLVDGPEIELSGYVVSSDKAGNFYRSFVIDDGTAAVEIMAGMYELHAIYAPGQRITLRPNGMTLGMLNSMLQLGYPSYDGYEVGYLEHRVVADQYIFRSEMYENVKPLELMVSELTESMVGRLVRIDDMVLDSEYSPDTSWSGDLKFYVPPADSVYVTTSSYASFARELAPHGTVSVTGVLLTGKIGSRSVYQLKIRDLDDVEEN